LLCSGLIVFAICLLLPAGAGSDSSSPLTQELEVLLIEGLQNNLQLQSLSAQVEQFKQEIGFAGAWEDPRIGLGLLNVPTDTFSLDQEPMTQKQISIAQKLPLFGKLDLKSKRAAILALRQQIILEQKRLEVARRITASYYDLTYVRSSLDTNAKLTDLVGGLLQVAETRYATGKALQQDVLQAQVELSKLLDDKISLKSRERMLEARVNALLSRDRFAPVRTGALPDLAEIRLDPKRLQQIGLAQNRAIAVTRVEIDQAELEVELARKQYWPDMDLRFAYGQRDEDLTGRDLPDFVSGQVIFNVPLWQNKRQDSQLEAARQKHQAAVKAHENLVRALPFRIDELVSAIEDTQQNMTLFRDALLVQADSWAESALVSYEVGKLEFNSMISAQLRQLQFELQTLRYKTTVLQNLAELDEILGRLPVEAENTAAAEDVSDRGSRIPSRNGSSASDRSFGRYWGLK
jgi:outer membrane protein TolC